MQSLYVHFPFCLKKCNYCDFYSIGLPSSTDIIFQEYTEALKGDLLQWNNIENIAIKSVYLGGGTPSVLPAEFLKNLFNFFNSYFKQFDPLEVTLEVNPATVNKEKMFQYKSMGITRISIGAQSFVDQELQLLGRQHSKKDILDSYQIIRDAGFENVSIDLMFRIPTQTLDSLKTSLESAVFLKPEHISIYSLTLEKGTKLAEDIEKRKCIYPTEELDFEMYRFVREWLKRHNYQQYEISNFAEKGYESIHNQNYWNNGEYIGLGAGAHSQVGGIRYYNSNNIVEYCEKGGKIRQKSGKITLSEAIFLGLRQTMGVNLNSFYDRYQVDLIEKYSPQVIKLKNNSMLEENGGYLRLTEKGIFLANRVFLEFM